MAKQFAQGLMTTEDKTVNLGQSIINSMLFPEKRKWKEETQSENTWNQRKKEREAAK